MKKILYVFLITCFSLTIFSCAKKDGSSGTATSFWSEQIGTSSYDNGTGVTLYSSDNIYVSGQSNGGLDGNINSWSDDIFLVKYNSSGTKQWTKQLGSSSSDFAWDVTVDSSDNIYVTGFTNGSLEENFNQGSYYDIFLVKYNSDGVKQ